MSRRERVLTALEHREPDRVPISMTITVDAYANLKKYMGIEIEGDNPKVGRWTDVAIHPIVADKYGLDVIRLSNPLNKAPNIPPKPDDPKVAFIDEWYCEWTKVPRPDGTYYFEISKHPLAGATVEDLDHFPWPEPEEVKDGALEMFRDVRENTDFAIMTKIGGAVFELATYMRGMEEWYMDLAINKEFATKLMAKIAEIQAQRDRNALKVVGKYIDVLRLSGEDMGSQNGPLISPRMFKKLVAPHLKTVWDIAKAELLAQNPNGKVMLHSCGSVKAFMKPWADMGIDVLDPVQVSAAEMDTAGLKAHIGDRLTFHGAIDTQQVLPFGTPEDVRQEVRLRIKDLAPGGGFLLAPIHNVQGDVPPENLIAMRDAVEEFGYYPIDL
ncbi:MAG: uroporphyrinogen decarboxylase [Anaerolineae bacterium]|nr:uroporphyrinogen decarboxylase [Anaerolineae bacterium]